jgi:hypothetical protein
MLLHSDLRRAEFCRLSYDPARKPDWEVPGLVRGFLDEEPEGPVVTIEGTRANVLEDWMRDLDQIATTRILGLEQLPNGFADDILAIIFAIIADLHGQPLGWNGHSKGGSEALIGSVLWLLSGNKCRRITALEPARVGSLGQSHTYLRGSIIPCPQRHSRRPASHRSHSGMRLDLSKRRCWQRLTLGNTLGDLVAYAGNLRAHIAPGEQRYARRARNRNHQLGNPL